MHAKPDLRVFLKWMITRSGSVITDVIRTTHLVNRNPYSSPAANTAPSVGRFAPHTKGLLAAFVGFATNSGWLAAWSGVSVFSFMGVFTATGLVFAIVSGYLLVRKAQAWAGFVVFGLSAVALFLNNGPNWATAAKLIAVQSAVQLIWTCLFLLLPSRHPSAESSG